MNADPGTPHKRRPRYKGTHPRRFEQKYKELNPTLYPETVQKVLAAGKTPAGTHRPIMVGEILAVLQPRAGEVAVDCTLGYGGHASELLPALQPGGRLIGLDRDPIELEKTEERLRLAWTPEQFVARRSNFAGITRVLGELGITSVDIVLADLGVSSMQLDDPLRGFSFKQPGPLDLRLDPTRGRSAADLLGSLSQEQIVDALREFADEPHAEKIAAAIVESAPILHTEQLTRALRKAVPRDAEPSIRRVFQALRILVNDEFGSLENLLRVLPTSLRSGGRTAFLTFHSGEDRRVKQHFAEGHRSGVYSQIAEEPLRASAVERHANPRASSAKLRWATRA